MTNGYRKLQVRITRRCAAALVAEALNARPLARILFGPGDAHFVPTAPEWHAFERLLMSKPEWGGPGVDFNASPVATGELLAWHPPDIPVFEDATSTVRFARPADHPGAICNDNGTSSDRPRGSLRFYLGVLVGLLLRGGDSQTRLPKQRRGGGRAGRPSQLDIRAVLRILVGLVRRCDLERPDGRDPVADPIVGPEKCVALLLWLDGHCRPAPPPPPGRRDPFRIDALPIVREVESHVASGRSLAELAKAIQNLTRGRDGEYSGYVKPQR